MADSLAHSEDIGIFIPEALTSDGFTKYVVQIIVAQTEWTVERRFKEFAELHESLVESGVDKDSLPGKKLIGNKDPAFIKKRRKELETYLQSVFNFLKHSLPSCLVTFLQFPSYDLHHILRAISSSYVKSLDMGKPLKGVEWTPLEMHALSERLKRPRPPEDCDDDVHGFTHAADQACQLEALIINGSEEKLGRSNIVPNKLSYDFLPFKNLTKLRLEGVEITPDRIGTFAMLRQTLKHLTANRCCLESVSQLLLGDSPASAENSPHWSALQFLDLRQNQLSGSVDDSIKLAPHLRTLLLGFNQISGWENLDDLSELCTLELASNKLEEARDLHLKLASQIARLDLSDNKIRSLSGCAKLHSLTDLNVSGNKVADLDNVFPVATLPNLQCLNLQGNHVTTCVDYRIKVFESFGKRCSDLCLDNELPTQQEVDKVSVLMALRVAREGKSPTSLFGNLPRRV